MMRAGLLAGFVCVAVTSSSAAASPATQSIDKTYLEAAKRLLGHGLADPRGGVFSRIDIDLWSPEPDDFRNKDIYGWVLPDGKHVVLLDGLEYAGFIHATPVDLDRAIGHVLNEPILGSSVGSNPALAALLLRVSRPDLAQKADFRWRDPTRPSNSGRMLFVSLEDRYKQLIIRDLWTGDYGEGLNWARGLAIEAATQDDFWPNPTTQLHGLPLANAIMADLKGRLEHPTTPDLPTMMRLPKEARIAALVQALNTVHGKDMIESEDLALEENPISSALYKEGQAAIPALIDAIRNDKRFTRLTPLQSGDGDGFDYDFRSVKQAACMMIEHLWPISSIYDDRGFEGPDPAILSKAWKAQANLSEPERWLTILRDDSSGLEWWEDASSALVRGGNTRDSRGHAGEIAHLMAARALSCKNPPVTDWDGVRKFDWAFQIGNCLADWDSKAAAPCLRSLCRIALKARTRVAEDNGLTGDISGPFGVAVADRLKEGDATAAADYRRMLSHLKPDNVSDEDDTFRPMWSAKTNRHIRAITRAWMAKWSAELRSRSLWNRRAVAEKLGDLAAKTGFLDVPAFRRLLVQGLKTSTTLGPPDLDDYIAEQKISGSKSIHIPKKEWKKRPVTLRDQLAGYLVSNRVQGEPLFDLKAGDSVRTKQRKTLIRWLENKRIDWSTVSWKFNNQS